MTEKERDWEAFLRELRAAGFEVGPKGAARVRLTLEEPPVLVDDEPSEKFKVWFYWLFATISLLLALAVAWAWEEWTAFLVAFLVVMAHNAERHRK